jgi:hypothetical protein
VIKKIKTFFVKQRIALAHAKYHRCMKRADEFRKQQNLIEFKKAIYQAEDAWRQLVILTEKVKEHG